jgi:hypothetical protein
MNGSAPTIGVQVFTKQVGPSHFVDAADVRFTRSSAAAAAPGLHASWAGDPIT